MFSWARTTVSVVPLTAVTFIISLSIKMRKSPPANPIALPTVIDVVEPSMPSVSVVLARFLNCSAIMLLPNARRK